jgi:hypothetical protein
MGMPITGHHVWGHVYGNDNINSYQNNCIFYLQFSSILDEVVDKDFESNRTIPFVSLNLVSKHLFNNGQAFQIRHKQRRRW